MILKDINLIYKICTSIGNILDTKLTEIPNIYIMLVSIEDNIYKNEIHNN